MYSKQKSHYGVFRAQALITRDKNVSPVCCYLSHPLVLPISQLFISNILRFNITSTAPALLPQNPARNIYIHLYFSFSAISGPHAIMYGTQSTKSMAYAKILAQFNILSQWKDFKNNVSLESFWQYSWSMIFSSSLFSVKTSKCKSDSKIKVFLSSSDAAVRYCCVLLNTVRTIGRWVLADHFIPNPISSCIVTWISFNIHRNCTGIF